MKNHIIIIGIAALMFSCKGQEQNSVEAVTESAVKTATKSTEKNPKQKAGVTHLCKINGEDWGYTKASGIVFTEKKNGKRMATITFKKKLVKGSESIQVEYAMDAQEISRIIVDVKKLDLTGKLNGSLYGFLKKNNTYSGSLINNGTVSFEDGLASGTAQFVCENTYEKSEFAKEFHYLEVTELKFKDIGCSDLNAVKKKLDALSG